MANPLFDRELLRHALRFEARVRYVEGDRQVAHAERLAGGQPQSHPDPNVRALNRSGWRLRTLADGLSRAAADLERCGRDRLHLVCCQGHVQHRPYTCKRAAVCESCARAYAAELAAKFVPRAVELANRPNVPQSERLPKFLTLALRRSDVAEDGTVFRRTMQCARQFFRVVYGKPRTRSDWRIYRELWPLGPKELERAEGSEARAWSRRRKLVARDKSRGRFGALYAFEWGGQSGNPHVHALLFGRYVPQGVLCRAWQLVTGDSYVVDVRSTRGTVSDVAREVLKYVCKFGSLSEERVAALYAAMLDVCEGGGRVKQRRRLECIGSMRKRGDVEQLDSPPPCLCVLCGEPLDVRGRIPFELWQRGIRAPPDEFRR